MKILIILFFSYIIFLFFKPKKQNTSKKTRNIVLESPKESIDVLATSLKNYRASIRSEKEKELQPLRAEVAHIEQDQIFQNNKADELGVRSMLCYLIDEMRYWSTWKENERNQYFFDELANIKGFELVSLGNLNSDFPQSFWVEFNFEGVSYKIMYDKKIFLHKKQNGHFNLLYEMATDYKSDEYTSYFEQGDVSYFEVGDWIKCLIAIEEHLRANSKKILLQNGIRA